MKAKLVETLERRKEMMIAALWSNPNLDDDKNTRQNAIRQLEDHYDEAITKIFSPPEEFTEEDENNPFIQAGRRGLKRLEEPRNDEGTVKQAIAPDGDGTYETDQI